MDQEVYGNEVEEISWYERMEMYERNPHLLKQEHEVEEEALIRVRFAARQQEVEILGEGQTPHEIGCEILSPHLDPVREGAADARDGLAGFADLHVLIPMRCGGGASRRTDDAGCARCSAEACQLHVQAEGLRSTRSATTCPSLHAGSTAHIARFYAISRKRLGRNRSKVMLKALFSLADVPAGTGIASAYD